MLHATKGLTWFLAGALVTSGWGLVGRPGQAVTGNFAGINPHHSSEVAPTLLAGRLRLNLGVRPSRYRVGGFRRSGSTSSCVDDGGMLQAIVPPTQLEEALANAEGSEMSPDAINAAEAEKILDASRAVDLTLSAKPTFFVYVPQLDESHMARFVLMEAIEPEDGDSINSDFTESEVYSTELEVGPEAGIVGVALPPSAPDLSVDKTYHWYFVVECDTASNEDNPLVDSWLTRISSNPPAPTQDLWQKVQYYLDESLWQDAVALSGQALYGDRMDSEVQQLWQDLMAAADLSQFADTPIVNIVQNPPEEAQQVSPGDASSN